LIVLALDSATAASVAGVLGPDGAVTEARDDPPPGSRGEHAARLLALAEAALERAGVGWADLDRLAVGVGPGGFTGLRIGVATARALAQARGLPLVPVSSLWALAVGAHMAVGDDPREGASRARAGDDYPREGASPPWAGGDDPREGTAPPPPAAPDVIAAVIDARRGEVFAAAWAGSEPLLAPAALSPQDLAERLAALGRPVQAVGDGAVRFRAELARAGVAVPADGSAVHRIGAEALCRLGAAGEPADRDGLLPDYRREPDAKPPQR
jgi:tRNA threonylcarbamoyladenosine biosynthesis protein TsaB